MRRDTALPELLAPAGGEAAFLAALAGGADAIYLGGQAYNARAFADNFDDETLARCITLAHARGVRVYVTLNTLLTDKELAEAVAYATRLDAMGADALICADTGLASLLAEMVPGLPLHASTQLSLHSAGGAAEVADLGFEQVVAARELTLQNLTAMTDGAPQTVEAFIHGALCVCHSGQCLFSSMVGGRSGNRGTCAQPCRLPYNDGKYPLSLKDLCLAAHIPALIASGVKTLKIEGRMKTPAYVYRVTRIYRRLLDEGRAATVEELRELDRVFSRDGSTDGYLTGNTGLGMCGVRRESDKAASRAAAEEVIPPLSPVPLRVVCHIVEGKPAVLTMTDPAGRQVSVTGEIPAAARSAPLEAQSVLARISKLGGTPYCIPPDAAEITVGEGLNMSPAALNALRRATVEKLCEPCRPAGQNNRCAGGRDATPTALLLAKRVLPSTGKPFDGVAKTALFMNASVYDAMSNTDKGFFDLCFLPLWQYGESVAPPRGVWLPPVITDGEEPEIRRLLEKARAAGATDALVGNPAQVRLAREAGFRLTGDFRLNITNSRAAVYWAGHGVEDAVLSPELTAPQMRDIGGRTIVYGRIPLMLTERCYATTAAPGACGHACERTASLTDRRGVVFPILRLPPHRNLILNSLPTYLGDRTDLLPSGIREHFLFTTESTEECRCVIAAYRAGKALPCAARRFPK